MRTPRRTRLRNLARIALLALAAGGLSACVYEGPYGYAPGYYSPGYYNWYRGYPYYPNYPYYGPNRDYRTPERRTAPARTFVVFFDWDKANLTARAKQIISEAAHASIATAVTKLNVNGYADTSGAAGYNMELSLRRANNVAAELVADGVDKSDIVIKGFGATHLLVPTGPNVRERQNRGVEIILH